MRFWKYAALIFCMLLMISCQSKPKTPPPSLPARVEKAKLINDINQRIVLEPLAIADADKAILVAEEQVQKLEDCQKSHECKSCGARYCLHYAFKAADLYLALNMPNKAVEFYIEARSMSENQIKTDLKALAEDEEKYKPYLSDPIQSAAMDYIKAKTSLLLYKDRARMAHAGNGIVACLMTMNEQNAATKENEEIRSLVEQSAESNLAYQNASYALLEKWNKLPEDQRIQYIGLLDKLLKAVPLEVF